MEFDGLNESEVFERISSHPFEVNWQSEFTLDDVEKLDNKEVDILLFRSCALFRRALMFQRPRLSPRTSNMASTTRPCSLLSRTPPGEATTSISGGL